MNNIDRFGELFIQFEVETKKKLNNDNLTLDECIKELKRKRYNPYIREDSFIDFCRKLRNINYHNINDNYYLITDSTIKKLEDILEEVRHPFKVSNKATINIYSKQITDKVLPTMKDMNEKSYTHIPIYSEDNKSLVGIFSENSLFQYLMNDGIIQVGENTTFQDIKECIELKNSKEIVIFVSKDELYDDVVNEFIKEFKNNNKLSCVMVTNSGIQTEKVIGIITAWDIIGRE